MPASPKAEALDRLIGFGRELRRRGLAVGTGRIVTFCRAAATLGTLDRTDLYWAARSSLVSRREDLEAFDAAFDQWFRQGVRLELDLPPTEPEAAERAAPDGSVEGPEVVEDRIVAREWRALADEEEAEGEAAIRIVASAAEVLHEKSFADLSTRSADASRT